jgi:tripartite-type tricarboxylate transporter receptor subunit TctC
VRLWKIALVLIAAAVGIPDGASAQSYPTKVVRIVVPFAAGGSTDLIGRTIAQKLQESLGQSVVVENRGGVAGNIGTDLVAKSAPDGYTLLLGYVSSFSVSPFLYPDLPYKPLADFEPISLVATSTNLMVAHPSLKVSNLKELQALAKSSKEKLLYSSSGLGTLGHLTVELFKSVAGIDLQHVPYNRGGGSALADLLAGRVAIYASAPGSLISYVRSGELKALGVSSPTRDPGLADIPTFVEQGFKMDATSWFGLLAPAGTPKEIVAKLNAAVVLALQAPDVKENFGRIGFNVETNRPDEFAAYIKADYEKWRTVIQSLGGKLE